MEGDRLFRKDRLGRQGGGIALCVREQLERTELCLGMDEEPNERSRTGASLLGGQAESWGC